MVLSVTGSCSSRVTYIKAVQGCLISSVSPHDKPAAKAQPPSWEQPRGGNLNLDTYNRRVRRSEKDLTYYNIAFLLEPQVTFQIIKKPKNMGTCPIRRQYNQTILENPVSPPSPEESVVISLCDYPSLECAELSMCIGERLTVISDEGDFMMARSTATGRECYVPTSYTARVTHRWLFTGISRFRAVELLMLPYNHSGAFLIRESETSRGCYSLSILRRTNSSYLDCVKHYRISYLQNGWVYISPGVTFPSLHHLVEHYSESADGLCSRLRGPCFIRGLDNSREARPVPTTMRRPTVNWKDISRSVIFRRMRTESDNSLVSEGLREAISSYLQMTDGNDHSWDT